MRRYENLFALVSNMGGDADNDWIYLNVKKWEEDPKNTEAFLINEDWLIDLQVDDPDRVAMNSKGEVIPLGVGDLEIETFIELQTLEGVVVNLRKGGEVNFDRLIKGVDYYRKYDDFLE